MRDIAIGQAPVATETTASTTSTQTDQPTNAQKKGGFAKILGNVLGGAVNVMAPAAGSILGGLVRGGGLGYAAEIERLMAQSAQQQMQLIGVQMRVQDRSQQFSTVSNLLKSRHDGEMEAIRNFKS